MKILVTGGAGYVGSVLVPMLLEKNYEITVLDNLMYGGDGLIPCFLKKNFKFVKGDVLDESIVKPLAEGADAIIHLAAIVGYPACKKDEKRAYDVNFLGTQTVGKFLRPDQLIIYASTGSNYGSIVGQVCTEETPLNPLTVYAKTKTMAERFLLDNCSVIALRYATAFGSSPRMRLDLMINDFVYQALHNRSLVVFEKSFKRTFIHIYDMARSFVFALENAEKMRKNIYNVGSDTMNFTKEDIVNKIKDRTGCYVHFAEFAKDEDQRNYEVSYQKIKNIGFGTTIDVDSGIDELINVVKMVKITNQYKNI
jgi:nucleoside-diphosphate-sugar epimerase